MGREDLPERAQDNAKYYSDQAREDSAKTDTDRKEVERLVESVSGIEEQVVKVEGLTKQAQHIRYKCSSVGTGCKRI